jgi:hypothetical protein
MRSVRNDIENQGARPSRVKIAVTEKKDEAASVGQTKPAVKAVEPQDAVRKQRDEKLDHWMENIKEFIRNIDVKSL